jgi:hypothetical protein
VQKAYIQHVKNRYKDLASTDEEKENDTEEEMKTAVDVKVAARKPSLCNIDEISVEEMIEYINEYNEKDHGAQKMNTIDDRSVDSKGNNIIHDLNQEDKNSAKSIEDYEENSDSTFDIMELDDEEKEHIEMLKSTVDRNDKDLLSNSQSYGLDDNDQVLVPMILLDEAEDKLQMKEKREKELEQQNQLLQSKIEAMQSESIEAINMHNKKIKRLEKALKTSDDALKAKSK